MLRSVRGAVNPPKTGTGRLARRVSNFEPGDLGAWLRTERLGRTSSYHETIGSTQDEARRLALGGAPHGHLVWAGAQTAGRGRLARQWHSPAMAGLWFSVILRPQRPAAEVAALPLAVGAAVATVLDREAPGSIGLKWPNDVLLDGRKVAGILVEAHTAAGIVVDAVVGIGINLRRPEGGFPAEIGGLAAALADVAVVPSPVALLAAILESLELFYTGLLSGGPAAARTRWLELADTIGREVTAQAAGRTITGTAVDLDDQGNLVVVSGDHREVISYGEIQQLR